MINNSAMSNLKKSIDFVLELREFYRNKDFEVI